MASNLAIECTSVRISLLRQSKLLQAARGAGTASGKAPNYNNVLSDSPGPVKYQFHVSGCG